MKHIKLEQDALIVLIGAMGTGKSTFAREMFQSHQIVESDFIRTQLTGDFENQDYNSTVFEILYATIDARAKAGLMTVIDSTGSQPVIDHVAYLSKEYDRPAYIIKFPNLKKEDITAERMKHRMKYIHVYHMQSKRVEKAVIPDRFQVIELDYGNNAVLDFKQYRDEFRLDPNYEYTIIPDLHGEYRAVEPYFISDPRLDNGINVSKQRFISLGDIVDRGESSYKTFQMINSMIKKGILHHVISNHDNKLYRWFQKWEKDTSTNKHLAFNNYGMKIAHGLEKTLTEFYQLTVQEQAYYAHDFIEYYESAKPYLFLEKEGEVHYFTHAGISFNIATGQKIKKRDISAALYETIETPEELEEIFKNEDRTVYHHVGHDYKFDEWTEMVNKDGSRVVVKHDIGLGKISIEKLPAFRTLK